MSFLGEWKSVEAFDLIIRLISRVSSRLLVGEDQCRDMTWLNASRGDHNSLFIGFIC